jgi:hypothetical protein
MSTGVSDGVANGLDGEAAPLATGTVVSPIYRPHPATKMRAGATSVAVNKM